MQYPYIPFCSFSLVVKCRNSNLRVLGSNPYRGTPFSPYFFQFPLIFNKPRGLWAPVFILFTVINCKIPLCSFNNTFNSWFTFVEPPTYPHPDLTPRLDPPPPRPRLFQFHNILNSWFTSTRPHPITPSTFQFYNNFNSWITSTRPPTPFFQFHSKFNSWFTRPTPGPIPITPITPTFFSFTITSIRGSHPPDPHPTTPDYFNFQIASVLGSHPRPSPPDPTPPPSHIQKRIFIRGICLEGPIVLTKCSEMCHVCLLFRLIKMSQNDLVIF